MNLGAIVTNTKGIATHMIHINGTMIKSAPVSIKPSINNFGSKIITKKANIHTINFPTTAAGIKFFSFADLIVTAPIAKPRAVVRPNNCL